MIFRQKFRIFLLVLGDFLIFYFSLFLSFCLRYLSFQKEAVFSGFKIFLPVSFFWLFIFYLGKVYDLNLLKNKFSYYNRLFLLFLIGISVSVVYFYLFYPHYRPKIVLIFLATFSFVFINLWHLFAYHFFKTKKIKALIIGEGESYFKIANELKNYLNLNPQLGYEIVQVISPQTFLDNYKNDSFKEIGLLIIDFSSFKNFKEEYLLNYQIIDLIDFYEMIFRKIPIELLSIEWFLKNVSNKNWDLFEGIKRLLDLLGAFVILIISLPFWPLIALLIKIDSEGPIFYISKRVGKNEKPFLIYKFRTMVKDASLIGPAWTLERDPRITRIGKFLRKTHIDEIPQLINILKGEMSFIGPRPEEEKLVELYKKEIPFYHYRFLIKPGILGWAQINYPHTSSVEEAKEKLGYDFFYLKNRSFILDLIIFLRVLISLFEVKTH